MLLQSFDRIITKKAGFYTTLLQIIFYTQKKLDRDVGNKNLAKFSIDFDANFKFDNTFVVKAYS